MGTGFLKEFVPVTRLERYTLTELWGAFGLGLTGLTLVLIAAGAYEPVREGLPLASLAKFVPLLIPYALPWTIPTAFVAACILVYSRMAGDNELAAVRASGVHLWRVLTPAAATAVLLAGVCGLLNHHVVPAARFYQYGVVKAANASEQAAAIRFSDPVMRIGKYLVHVGEVEDDDSCRDIVVVMPEKVLAGPEQEGYTTFTYVRAPRGQYTYSDARSQIVFVLRADPARNTPDDPHGGDGVLCKSIHGTGKPRNFEWARFRKCTFRIVLRSMADLQFLPHKAKHMTTELLIRKVHDRLGDLRAGRLAPPDVSALSETQAGYEQKRWQRLLHELRHWQTDVHKRSAFSLAPLFLGMVAVPLGVLTRRGRRLVAFALAIAVVLGGYYPLMAAASALGESGMLPPAVAVWGVSTLIAGAGAVLLWHVLRR